MSNAFWAVLYNIRIQDLFDIAIIAILIYVILVWFMKVASRFVLLGIGLLGAVYLVAQARSVRGFLI